MALRTCAASVGSTVCTPLTTRETVLRLTPAARATSFILGRPLLPPSGVTSLDTLLLAGLVREAQRSNAKVKRQRCLGETRPGVE
ncbi:hypothetical protein Q0Z83_024670 [Actinoplanes sichuanensis]|nr:hypothetical protein Q0Z83_024670 [Actinoplanes sichuanensis]